MAILSRASHKRRDTDHTDESGSTRAEDRQVPRQHGQDRPERSDVARANAYERFGGINWGAAFFGWLVAIAVTVLLTSIVGAVVAGVSESTNVTQSEA